MWTNRISCLSWCWVRCGPERRGWRWSWPYRRCSTSCSLIPVAKNHKICMYYYILKSWEVLYTGTYSDLKKTARMRLESDEMTIMMHKGTVLWDFFTATKIYHSYWSKKRKQQFKQKKGISTTETRSVIFWAKFPISHLWEMELYQDDVFWRICWNKHLWSMQSFCPEWKLHWNKQDTSCCWTSCPPVQIILEQL